MAPAQPPQGHSPTSQWYQWVPVESPQEQPQGHRGHRGVPSGPPCTRGLTRPQHRSRIRPLHPSSIMGSHEGQQWGGLGAPGAGYNVLVCVCMRV